MQSILRTLLNFEIKQFFVMFFSSSLKSFKCDFARTCALPVEKTSQRYHIETILFDKRVFNKTIKL